MKFSKYFDDFYGLVMFLSYPNNTYNQIKPSFPRKKERFCMPEVIFGPRRNAAARKLAASQNTDKHPNWGGRRPGSGRKPAGERPLDAMIVVRMTDKQKAFFKMAGGSAWLRRVLEVCMERKQFNMASDRDPNEKELLGGLEIDDILPESLSSKSTGF